MAHRSFAIALLTPSSNICVSGNADQWDIYSCASILLRSNYILILLYFPKEKLIIQRVKVRIATSVSAMPFTSNGLRTHT